MYFRKFIACIFVLYSSCIIPNKLTSLLKKKATVVSTFETRNCFITYIIINGHRFLVKQKKLPNKQISVVRDALAAYIARDLKIAHSVVIIAYNKEFEGKMYKLWPATLHTIAPGETVRKQRNSKFNLLRLRQWWAHVQSFEQQGLTKQIIEHMTWHKQLPIIVGLDLIVGNSDRHCGNLFYDPETDSFWAIDMDDTFNKDLCEIAYKKLVMMTQEQKIVFTQQEIAALRQLRNTMSYLINRHKVPALIKKMYHFAKKAGFVPGQAAYSESIKRKLNDYAATIEHTWNSAHNLIRLLDAIIQKHTHRIKNDVESLHDE